MKQDKKRIELIDELRGFAMIFVILYHLGYDLAGIFGVPMAWFWGPAVSTARDVAAGSLIVLSGVSCSLTRSNLKRGLRTFSLGMALTLVTYLLMPSELIVFGILHLLGACMLLYGIFEPALKRVSPAWGMLVSVALYLITRPLPDGAVWIPFAGLTAVPGALAKVPWLFWLGIVAPGFYSADYYPLLPFGMLFLFGGFAGIWFLKRGFPAWSYPKRAPFLSLIGRRTLLVYLVHQPLLLAVLWAAFSISGR